LREEEKEEGASYKNHVKPSRDTQYCHPKKALPVFFCHPKKALPVRRRLSTTCASFARATTSRSKKALFFLQWCEKKTAERGTRARNNK